MPGLGAASFTAPTRGFAPAAPTNTKLGFDNFSVRAFNWKAPRLIEYAASLKVDTLLLSDLEVYGSLDEGYLGTIRVQADRAGIELQAGTSSICPTSQSYNESKWGKAEDHARLLVRTAKRLGSSVARCYLGSRRDRDGVRHPRRAAARLEARRHTVELTVARPKLDRSTADAHRFHSDLYARRHAYTVQQWRGKGETSVPPTPPKYRDRRTAQFAEGRRIKEFKASERQAYKRLEILEATPTKEALVRFPSNRFEALGGDCAGQYSIRVNRQWRICVK